MASSTSCRCSMPPATRPSNGGPAGKRRPPERSRCPTPPTGPRWSSSLHSPAGRHRPGPGGRDRPPGHRGLSAGLADDFWRRTAALSRDRPRHPRGSAGARHPATRDHHQRGPAARRRAGFLAGREVLPEAARGRTPRLRKTSPLRGLRGRTPQLQRGLVRPSPAVHLRLCVP